MRRHHNVDVEGAKFTEYMLQVPVVFNSHGQNQLPALVCDADTSLTPCVQLQVSTCAQHDSIS